MVETAEQNSKPRTRFEVQDKHVAEGVDQISLDQAPVLEPFENEEDAEETKPAGPFSAKSPLLEEKDPNRQRVEAKYGGRKQWPEDY